MAHDFGAMEECDSDTSSISNDHGFSSDEDDEDEDYEDGFVTSVTKLTELMFAHKQAFEAETSEMAEPAVACLCQARQDQETKPTQGLPLGHWIEHLLHWDKGPQSKPFPEGRWRDGTGTFYRGATIEIKPDGWRPEGFRQGRSKSVSYEREPLIRRDEHYLVERWSSGEKRRFKVMAAEDHNFLHIEDSMFQWTLEKVPKWDRWEHYDALEWVWGRMTAIRIGKILSVLGPACANRFLHALAVKIPGSLMGTLSLQSNPALKVVASFPGDFRRCDKEDDVKDMVPKQLKRTACSVFRLSIVRQKIKSLLAGLCQGQVAVIRTKVVLYFCGVNSLMGSVRMRRAGGAGRRPDLDHVEFLLHLTALPNEAKAFTAPLGQAAAANCWDLAVPHFFRNRAKDVVLITLFTTILSPSTYSFVSEQPVLPKQWQILLVVLLIFHSAACVLVEFAGLRAIGSGRPTRCRRDFRNLPLPIPLNVFTFIRVLLELYSLAWGVRLIINYFVRHWKFPESIMIQNLPYMGSTDAIALENTRRSCLGTHPVGLGALIFAKFLQLTMALLNVPLLRRTLLPAWYAIKSPESVACLGYMLCLTCGCTLTLLGLPYNTYFHEELFSKAFLQMFRINFMSDFGMAHFKSQEEKEVTTCIQIYVCLMAFIFPVVLLNVYVGVVSEAYQTFKANLTQISCDYMVESTLQELLQRWFWGKFHRGVFKLHGCCPHDPANRSKGIWICMPVQFVEDTVPLDS